MREFEILRKEFPASFVFDGVGYREYFDADINKTVFLPIKAEALEKAREETN